MQFNDYQKKAISTDLFDEGARKIDSMAFFSKLLGLVGESGEVADKFKKIYRDQNGKITPEQIEGMKKELGDVLWYIAVIAQYLDIRLEDIAELNLAKLQDRKKRGVISGSGDNR